MSISTPCSIPKIIQKYLDFFEKNEINVCISGGYSVYLAGFCHCYTDVDIFINNFNFNEKLFRDFDNQIEVVPNEGYVNVVPFKKRYGITVNSDTVNYKLDFVLMNCGRKIENNYSFSEYVTAGFDVDICRVSITKIGGEYRLIFNSNFKVFIKSETQECSNDYDEDKIPIAVFKRFKKYERRLKHDYCLFFAHCAPPFDFDHLMKFHQLNMDW